MHKSGKSKPQNKSQKQNNFNESAEQSGVPQHKNYKLSRKVSMSRVRKRRTPRVSAENNFSGYSADISESSSSSSEMQSKKTASTSLRSSNKNARELKTPHETQKPQKPNLSSKSPGYKANASKWNSPESQREREQRSTSGYREAHKRCSRDRKRGSHRGKERSHDRQYQSERNKHYTQRNKIADRWDNQEQNESHHQRNRTRDQYGQNSEQDERLERSHRSRHERHARDDYENLYEHSPKRSVHHHNHRQHLRDEDENSFEWGEKRDNVSGALAEDTDMVDSIEATYTEPPEARKPKRRWRLYPFKGENSLSTLHIHRQSCFLVGHDRKVADLVLHHPSCSELHAAFQYRLVPFKREDGTKGKRVRLFLMDLNSENGTFLNNQQIETRKYYELAEKDVIRFAWSKREYVVLHEHRKEDKEDDDVDVDVESDDIYDYPNL